MPDELLTEPPAEDAEWYEITVTRPGAYLGAWPAGELPQRSMSSAFYPRYRVEPSENCRFYGQLLPERHYEGEVEMAVARTMLGDQLVDVPVLPDHLKPVDEAPDWAKPIPEPIVQDGDLIV